MGTLSISIASPETFDAIVQRLPADVRAQLRWAPQHIAQVTSRMLTEPMLTDGVIEQCVDQFMVPLKAIAGHLKDLASAVDQAVLEARLAEDLKKLNRLRPASMRAAFRAGLTCMVLQRIGVTALQGLPREALEQMIQALAGTDLSAERDSIGAVEGQLVLSAVLKGAVEGSPIPGRVDALARRADAVAERIGTILAGAVPPFRLPWYWKEPADAEKFSAFAKWAEPTNAVADLFKKWRSEASDQDIAAWDETKRDLDVDRVRKLFP